MEVKVVHRGDIPSISSVESADQSYCLGEHRDFRRNEYLKKFIPENSRLSISWTKLNDGETLNVHQHPVSSMVVVCGGNGELIGDLNLPLQEGDVIAIPPGCKHGFVGGSRSLHALSIQFEGKGLYEDIENPRVAFCDHEQKNSLEELIEYNDFRIKNHVHTDFFNLVRSGDLRDQSKCQMFERLLKSWSEKFQQIMFLRQGSTQAREFYNIFRDHLGEEIGHEKLINTKISVPLWDPVIDSCAEWFLSIQ